MRGAHGLQIGVMAVLAWGVAGYAVVAYGLLPLGALVLPAMKAVYEAHPVLLYGHVFPAALALALGPWQFMPRLRRRRPALHRWTGRAYLGVGVLVGGLFGLCLSPLAQGGPAARVGLGAMALAWLFTGARAWLAIRRGDVAAHRRWMVRNFAITLAAVTLRLELSAALFASLSFEVTYPVVAWLSWLPNLAVAELWLRRSNGALAHDTIPAVPHENEDAPAPLENLGPGRLLCPVHGPRTGQRRDL